VAGCIFCDERPLTNAHVFRKAWLDQIFPGSDPYRHRHVRRGEGGHEKTWSKDEADIKVRCVCETCNGGWMDQLDHAAEDLFLTQAATGFDVRLERESDKAVLARWCSLVAALLDQTQAEPVLDASAHRPIYNGCIPDGVFIWLFRTEPPPSQVSVVGESRTWKLELASRPAEEGNAYFTTFGVNHFVAQVFMPTSKTFPGIGFQRKGYDEMGIQRRLWPSTLMTTVWPPPMSVAWEELPELANSFHGSF
jgi:hypothetical protein